MHSYGKAFICTECFVKRKLQKGSPVNKYGTAEHVEKVGGKAVISDRKLQARDLAKVLKKAEVEKTAEVVTVGRKRKGRKARAVVADADYRQEDEDNSSSEE